MNFEPQQKQISISISKIFNWPHSESNCTFDLIFYPEDSEIPIIEKSASGQFQSNSMNLNASLKITYTSEENKVIMKMIKRKQDKQDILGQFQINLDDLRQKNVQYFPFGKDYVLQINVYNPMKANSRSSRVGKQQKNNNIIERNSRLNSDLEPPTYKRTPQREPFYQRKRIPSRILSNERNPTYPENYETKVKKSFSQKVFSLLQQVKSMKQEILVGSNRDTKQEKKNFKNLQVGENNPRVKKSMSDTKFRTYGTVTSVASPSFRRQQISNKAKQPQKHRLILKTLNVVPCDQYYINQSSKNEYGNRVENCRTSFAGQQGSRSPGYNEYYQPRYN